MRNFKFDWKSWLVNSQDYKQLMGDAVNRALDGMILTVELWGHTFTFIKGKEKAPPKRG